MPIPSGLARSSRYDSDFSADSSQISNNFSVWTSACSMSGCFRPYLIPRGNNSNQTKFKRDDDETSQGEEYSRNDYSTVGAATASSSVFGGYSFSGETAAQSAIISIARSEVDSRDAESMSRAETAEKRYESVGTDADDPDWIALAPSSDSSSKRGGTNKLRPLQSNSRDTANSDESDNSVSVEVTWTEESNRKSDREDSEKTLELEL
jgi:hypothetical protein